jgi:two-component system sensor histidine kinase ChiS
LECEIDKDVFVKADPTAVNRIVNNLVENAIKYSESSTVVSIILRMENGLVYFTVKDQGIGIRKELQEKVLEPYYQINHAKKSSQGLGLGLPIVKKVVDSLEGRLIIESDPPLKSGTVVKVELKRHLLKFGETMAERPPTIAEAEEITLPQIANGVFDGAKQTLLIVEDNLLMVNYLQIKLMGRYNICIAFNGAEAMERLEMANILPDIIISDIMMDVMDGFTFGERISKSAELNHIPILFLSARSAKSDRLLGFEVGAIDYIEKPFDMPELEKKIAAILARSNNQKRNFLTSAVRALTEMEVEPGQALNFESENKFSRNCDSYSLTSREKAIAKQILAGATYKEIAGSLFISERTVTTHVQNIFEKVRVNKKIELINRLTA